LLRDDLPDQIVLRLAQLHRVLRRLIVAAPIKGTEVELRLGDAQPEGASGQRRTRVRTRERCEHENSVGLTLECLRRNIERATAPPAMTGAEAPMVSHRLRSATCR